MSDLQKEEKVVKKIKALDVIFWIAVLSILLSAVFFKYAYIRSGSMEPVLHVGAIVIVNPYAELKEGDIAMYNVNSSNIVHRIVSIDGDKYIFKGDNVSQPDLQPIPKDNVIGKVVFKTNLLAPILGDIVGVE